MLLVTAGSWTEPVSETGWLQELRGMLDAEVRSNDVLVYSMSRNK